MHVTLPLFFLANNLNSIFLSLLNCLKVSLYILAVSNLIFFRNIKKWSSFNFRERVQRIRNYLVTLSRCYVGRFGVFKFTKNVWSFPELELHSHVALQRGISELFLQGQKFSQNCDRSHIVSSLKTQYMPIRA